VRDLLRHPKVQGRLLLEALSPRVVNYLIGHYSQLQHNKERSTNQAKKKYWTSYKSVAIFS
jgi:hypothetical protein|tara:strand:+ start:3453 stop:3635 length:183 start_codon:yes stop_codon:yes gene_type:complete